MRIHQIIIQGFKSYKDQTVVEPFSPKHNVIVGRNGSGKSNFFFAIRFVLGDVYSAKMSAEERQSLLHEGTGPATLSAFVEIVFDNSDQRFPTGKDTVILRRTIGLKKDDYSLDRKTVTKTDVTNLLQSAGFSKSNPYFIVPQGRVTFLTNASDKERFDVLKEVAGTKIYENHRVESLKIMDETDGKRKKIEELLAYIEERLAELEGEKDELKAYHDLDKNRRAIEYSLYSKECEEAQEELENMENERVQIADRRDIAVMEVKRLEKEIEEFETEAKALKNVLKSLSSEKQQIEDEKAEKVKSMTHLELSMSEIEKNGDIGGKKRLEGELKKIERAIDVKTKELNKITPQFEKNSSEIVSTQQELASLESTQDELLSKFGRSKQFKSQKEKDAWLSQEIEKHQLSISKTLELESALECDLESLEKELKSKEMEVNDKRCQLESRVQSLADNLSEIQKLKHERESLMEKKKELWREDSKIEQLIKSEEDEKAKAQRHISGMMDKNVNLGIHAVERIKNALNLQGVYGPLYQLLEVDEDVELAVDTVAGQSLFHIVVENDEVASTILEILNREKSGRVTFMPLNRLNGARSEFPKIEGCSPLISHIKYDVKFERAMNQVFGKTCLCDSLEVGQMVTKNHGLSAITLDGDRMDKKGAITGGYMEKTKNRFKAIKELNSHSAGFLELQRNHSANAIELSKIDDNVAKAVSQIQVLERTRRNMFEERDPLSNEVTKLGRDIREIKDLISQKISSKASIESSVNILKSKIGSLKDELGCSLKLKMTENDMQKLNEISNEIERLKQALVESSSINAEIGARKIVLEKELSTKLHRELEEAKSKIQFLEETDYEGQMKDMKDRWQEFHMHINSLNERDGKIEKTLDSTAASIREKNQRIDKLKSELAEANSHVDDNQKKSDKSLSKRSLFIQKKEESLRKIRDLGILPEVSIESFGKHSSAKLLKMLHETNDDLKKYSHVNKKAYEQYSNFTKQRDVLNQRKNELDKSAASIEEFVTVLDQRKDEAIERTYQQVSSAFKTTFESLVPNGAGELERPTYSGDNDESRGLSIKVSFNSRTDEGLKMQQLSGGQKSVVALAFIFAIQQCDPAPFYLFDEIDANLDAAYRTAVASMIHDLSEKAQFITTTFRPELLAHADKFYGVTFGDKVSSIDPITKDAALEFIEKEQAT